MSAQSPASTTVCDSALPSESEPLDRDFSKLWFARALSDGGAAITMGALPLIAVRQLDASALQVSLLAVAAGLVGAVFALPLGPLVESHRKWPAMVTADVLRAVLFISVPVAALAGMLSFGQLLIVSGAAALGNVVFAAASTAHLKNLVAPARRTEALEKLEATFWLFNSIGPALGGGIIQLFGATTTLAVQALGLLASAAGIRAIKRPEPEPPAKDSSRAFAAALAGFAVIARDPVLRPLLISSAMFSAFAAWTSPLELVLLLRGLDLPAWLYGLALALPCVGGLLGSWWSPRLARRFGQHRALVLSAMLRGLPLLVLPFLPAGIAGAALYVLATFLLLVFAGVFRPLYSAVRMEQTDDSCMTRVTTAFTLCSLAVAPLFALLGGLLASAAGVRASLLVGVVGLIVSGFFLPRREQVGAAEQN